MFFFNGCPYLEVWTRRGIKIIINVRMNWTGLVILKKKFFTQGSMVSFTVQLCTQELGFQACDCINKCLQCTFPIFMYNSNPINSIKFTTKSFANLSITEVYQQQPEQQLVPRCRRRVRSCSIKPSKLEVEGKH